MLLSPWLVAVKASRALAARQDRRSSPGQDGLVRVATVKTADRTYTRPIVKLVPLPVTDAAPESQGPPPHGGRHDLI